MKGLSGFKVDCCSKVHLDCIVSVNFGLVTNIFLFTISRYWVIRFVSTVVGITFNVSYFGLKYPYSISYRAKGVYFFTTGVGPMWMMSLWQSINCTKNSVHPLNFSCVCWEGWNVSKEELWVSVCQLASKLQADKVGGWFYCPEIKPGRTRVVRGELMTEYFWNLQLWHFVTLTALDLQRPRVPL